MGSVADFTKYKARRDYSQALVNKGWIPDRVEDPPADSVSIYIYDDYTQLLLFSTVQQTDLKKIIQRVHRDEGDNLLFVAEKLSDLISDLALSPPFQGDIRLSIIAQAAVWFAGFSLSLINSCSLDQESLVIFRLIDTQHDESMFHLAHLSWPEIMERADAESQLSEMAKLLRSELIVQG